jgi:hypothetical protein
MLGQVSLVGEEGGARRRLLHTVVEEIDQGRDIDKIAHRQILHLVIAGQKPMVDMDVTKRLRVSPALTQQLLVPRGQPGAHVYYQQSQESNRAFAR